MTAQKYRQRYFNYCLFSRGKLTAVFFVTLRCNEVFAAHLLSSAGRLSRGGTQPVRRLRRLRCVDI